MEFKGTKGEWVHNPRNGVHTKNGSCIALSHSSDDETRFYDAKLISASRELLEALMSIENDNGQIPESIWKMRNKAIEKALK